VKRLNEQGAVLLQTVLFIVLMGMMYAMWLNMSMGRYIWGSRAIKSEKNLHRLAAVEALVQACLHDGQVGRINCAPSGAETACFPTKYDGIDVKVKVSGFSPGCTLRISLEE
jgi:hypothetical protein